MKSGIPANMPCHMFVNRTTGIFHNEKKPIFICRAWMQRNNVYARVPRICEARFGWTKGLGIGETHLRKIPQKPCVRSSD